MKLTRTTVAGATAISLTLLAAAACVAPAPVVNGPVGGPAAPPAQTGGTFLEPFNGAPGAPTPFSSANWDVQVHSRDQLGTSLEDMAAQHGADCAGPPATHLVNTFDGAVFRCRDHMMTAINATGYGVIYLTPNHMVDFSRSEAVVSVDVSTLISSRRDWWDIWITPFGDNLALPGEDWYPDLQGPPKRAIHIRMDAFNGNETGFTAEVYDNYRFIEIAPSIDAGYERVLTPDAARRDTFELRISQNHLKFGMPAYNMWWVDSAISPLGWNQGVVQFGHHSYNPTKDTDVPNSHPGTWHWDNVSISPARPFTMINANERVANPTATFPSPAPANAFLRFAGYGTNFQISVDGGRSWTTASRAAQVQNHDDHFSSYWTPVPPGTTTVQFRAQPGCCPDGPVVRDVGIWAA